MNWLSELLGGLARFFHIKVHIKAGGHRDEAVQIIESHIPEELKVCIPKIFYKHRRFPWNPQYHSLHLKQDGKLDWLINGKTAK